MTITKNHLVTAYLFFLAATILVKTVTTVYSGSMVVNHGQKVAQLQQQKQVLEHQRAVYTQTIAQSTSLHRLTDKATTNNFEAISNPLVVAGASSVASAL